MGTISPPSFCVVVAGVIAGSALACNKFGGCGKRLADSVVLASPCMGRPMEKSGVEIGLGLEELGAALLS